VADVNDYIEKLKDPNSTVREHAAYMLGKRKCVSGVPALIEALKDEDWYVRWYAAEAIVKISSPAAPAVREALRDGNKDMKKKAAWALGRIGDHSASDVLIEALKDGNKDVRKNAAESLEKIEEKTPGSVNLDAVQKSLKELVKKSEDKEAAKKEAGI